MSMLQQILDQMFVDPEILDALDEEQKQILFIKMREEQVKRWKAFEEKCEKEEEEEKHHQQQQQLQKQQQQTLLKKKNRDDSKRIKWLKGSDGEVWVWVMGEHKDDLSLEELIEKRDLEEARKLAEEEMLENIRLTELEDNSSTCLYPNEDETTLKQQLSRMGMATTHHNDTSNESQPKTEKAALSAPKASAPTVDTVVINSTSSGIGSDNQTKQIATMKPTVTPIHQLNPPQSQKLVNNATSGIDNNNSQAAAAAVAAAAASIMHNDFIKSNGAMSVPPTQTFIAQQPSVSTSVSMYEQQRYATLPNKVDFIDDDIYNVKFRYNSATKPYLSDEDISKRQSEIFEMMKEKHKKIVKEAEIEEERVKCAWEEQERKAREAESQIRQIAQKAREQHRQQSLRTSTSILPALKDTKALSLYEAIRNLPRPPKPKSRQAIVDWFRAEELPRGTGLDPKTQLPARWFHGIISRSQADSLLKGRPVGSYLVRVSERIWGYTLSYVVDEGNATKHFLIERIAQGYQFLGTHQVVHEQLYDLITYHETAPITMIGNEILKWPVGQNSSTADYADLLGDHSDPPYATQRANTLPASIYRRY